MITHEAFTDLSAKFSATAVEYAQAPDSQTALNGVLEARRAIAQHIAGIAKLEWDDTWIARFQSILDALAKSGLWDLGVDEQDLAYAATLGSKSGPMLAAHMILIPAWQWAEAPRIDEVPMAMWGAYASYIFYSPTSFTELGHAESYGHQALRWLEELCRLAEANRGSAAVRAALAAYIEKSSGVPLQLSSLNLVRHYELRGRILTIAHNVGAQIPEVPIPRDGRRLNIGFIAMDFGPQTETYTLFPWFENLDPERFDVHLFAIKQTNTAVEQYIASKANGIRFLGNDTDLQLSTLRSASLDVLVFGGNLTADLDELTRLALYRIAPLQVANQSSNGTTGLPEIDLCISGALTDPEKSSEQYSERLAILPIPAHTFNYTTDDGDPICHITRKDIQVPDDAVLFISASDFYKITPEMIDCWAELLSRTPNSFLLVHPCSEISTPNASERSKYLIDRLTHSMEQALTRHGINHNRLIISNIKFPGRADAGALLGLGDVYLDTYPLGAVSAIINPLERGIPVIAWEGIPTRSRPSASILHQLGIHECCASDKIDYLKLGIQLATVPAFREKLAERIRPAMEQLPVCFDGLAASDAFGELIGLAFDELVALGHSHFRKTRASIKARIIEDPASVLATANYLAEIGMSAEATSQICRILAANPTHQAARRQMAQSLAAAGNHKRAVEYLLAVVQSASCPASDWRDLSTELRKTGHGDGARQALETALRIEPKNTETWLLLGELAQESQHTEIYEDACHMLQQLAPDDPQVRRFISARMVDNK